MKRMKPRFKVFAVALALAVLAGSSAPAEEASPRLKVVTVNVWGIISAQARPARMAAIGRELARLNPDVIALQEAFEYRHREILLEALAAGGYEFAEAAYFRKHLYGSGLMLISRYPIEEIMFEPYRVSGTWHDLERLGGKGIAYARLQTPWGPLDFFLTHVIARMEPIFDQDGNFLPGDPKQNDRLLQIYQLDRFVRSQRGAWTRSMIAAGDFNVSPEMLEYRFLVNLTGFENSFDLLHPGKNPSTFSKENGFVDDDYSRIDHIFFKNYEGSSGFFLRPVSSELVMTERFTNPRDMKLINYSDHYGLMTEFEVELDEPLDPSPLGVGGSCLRCLACPLEGGGEEGIELVSDNYRPWQCAAFDLFGGVYQRKDREHPLVVTMAEVVAEGEVSEPVSLPVPESARPALQSLIGGACGPRPGK